MSYIARVVEFLDLLVSIVLEEVDHVFVDVDDLRVLPRGGRHVHEAIQIVDAKADVDSVLRSQLNLILAIPRKSVRQVNPS